MKIYMLLKTNEKGRSYIAGAFTTKEKAIQTIKTITRKGSMYLYHYKQKLDDESTLYQDDLNGGTFTLSKLGVE